MDKNKKQIINSGLYLVSTPIGNMEDITLRALNVLKESDIILCEDTRRSGKLLSHLQIESTLWSYHKFNEKKVSKNIIESIKKDKIISLISDAGTPAISDPGMILINKCIKENLNVCPIPGSSAVTSAVSVSGFSDQYLFYGFLTKKKNELNNLFKQLKNSGATKAIEIENQIWKIWSIHPSSDRRGYRLTELLAQGSLLMARKELNKAYEIFSQIILVDPNWSEAWNKRATVLYLLGRYQQSQKDIDEVLKLEKRHFGALSGQGLVQTELKNYEKAINSYIEVQKIYPAMQAPKVMIPRLKELIKGQST